MGASVNSASAQVLPSATLVHTLSHSPETYLTPAPSYNTEWSDLAKQYADLLAADVSNAQAARQQALRKKGRKRKRAEDDDGDDEAELRPLQIRAVHVDGFTVRQIWEQINKVLKASREEIQRDATLLEKKMMQADGVSEEQRSRSASEQPSSEGDGEQDEEEGDFEGLSDQSDAAEDDDEEDGDELDEEVDDFVDEDAGEPEPSQIRSSQPKKPTKPDPFGLNDGFFSIDEFNAQSAMFERKDVKGEDDDEEDGERINWDADPNAAGGMEDLEEEEEDDDEEEDDEDEDENMDDVMGLGNTNDVMYADFFGPPDPLAALDKRIESKRKAKGTQNKRVAEPEDDYGEEDDIPDVPQEDEEEEERNLERAISDVRRDLFDDEEDDDLSSSEARKATDTLQSTHERQQMKILDEIRRLEAANVAKREWALAGEAEARDRPVNSLIEEDLDFERVGKPVPVISNEVSEEIEALIKRRIVAREFDEVVRRHPGSLAAGARGPRTPFVLEETKSQKSLGELYEADFHRANDAGYVDERDAKLSRERAEIATAWKQLAAQLDVLTSWHHRPAPPQASISVVKDAATIEMEEARPGVSGAVDETRTLAPQEVYAPGRDSAVEAGEVVLKSGAAVSKDEMTREEKHRRRRKEKRARAKKFSQENAAAAAAEKKGEVSKKVREATEKKQIVADLKKGGVKVIGKGGSLTDVTGGQIKENRGADEPRKLKL